MPGKSLTPDQIAEAVSLRAAGYTVTAISERLGASVRTLNRVFERHATKKGAVKDEIIAAAKDDLIRGITSREDIRQQAARLLADDLAHVAVMRRRMAEAAEHLKATNVEEAALVMRACAAHSTAVKNGSDLWRHVLRIDRVLDGEDEADLPELVIIEISAEDALRMQQEHAVDQELPDALPAPADPADEAVDAREEDDRVSEEPNDCA